MITLASMLLAAVAMVFMIASARSAWSILAVGFGMAALAVWATVVQVLHAHTPTDAAHAAILGASAMGWVGLTGMSLLLQQRRLS